jgi:hypothetical protein
MLAALAIAGGLFTTLIVGARAEMRVRGVSGPMVAFDLDLAPFVDFETKSHDFDFKLSYAMDITQPDLEMGFPWGPSVFQLGGVSFWYHTKNWAFSAAEGGSFGTMNFTYLTPYLATPTGGAGLPPVTQIVPCTDLAHCASETVNYGSSGSTITGAYSRDRDTVMLTPSYSVSGGLDEASKAIVPIVSIPRADVLYQHVLGRRDKLSTLADATAADSTPRACNPDTGGPPLDPTNPNPPICAPRAQWIGLREMWEHKITRRLSLELTGGATVSRTEIDPSKPYTLLPYPVVGARLDYLLRHHDSRPAMHTMVTDPTLPSIYAIARVEPVVDTHWGVVDPRFELAAGVLQPVDESYTILAHASFVRSLPPTPLEQTFLIGEAEVMRRLDHYRFDVAAGLRGAYMHDPVGGDSYVLSGFLALIWHEPRVAFH